MTSLTPSLLAMALIGSVGIAHSGETQVAVAGSVWEVPAERHQPIRQDAVMLKRGADNPAAQALFDDLKGVKARAMITEYGYDL